MKAEKYYFDTCTWRDFYEDRKTFEGKDLGKQAANIFKKIISKKKKILFSDLTIKELQIDYTVKEITDLFNVLFLSRILQKVTLEKDDYDGAKSIAKERNIPLPDAVHVMIAKRNDAVIISQDAHMQKVKDLVVVKKLDEL